MKEPKISKRTCDGVWVFIFYKGAIRIRKSHGIRDGVKARLMYENMIGLTLRYLTRGYIKVRL